MTTPPGGAAARADGPTHPSQGLEPLPDFLERQQLQVLDVVPAAAPSGRRLLVGDATSERRMMSIAVAEMGPPSASSSRFPA